MCIIVAKPVNVDFPSWNTLETCFDSNPDGAGFMYNTEDGRVHIEKGFMSWKEFKMALKRAKRVMPKGAACVMHFRIKTHGEVSKECCHPFPLEGTLSLLRETVTDCELGVAHNGIISGRNTNAQKSDTMDYIMHVLYPLHKLCGEFVGNKYANHLINDTIDGCRLAILNGKGEINFTGSWITENGVSYSNSSFREPRYVSSCYSSMHSPYAWDYYDDYDYYAGGYYNDYKSYSSPSSHAAKKEPTVNPVEEVKLNSWYGDTDSEDDWDWAEDYIRRVDPLLWNEMPCKECLSKCPDWFDCVEYGHWVCHTKGEALETIAEYEDTVRYYEMKAQKDNGDVKLLEAGDSVE